jgi:hypothetical protein
MNNDTTTSKRPTHTAFSVRDYTVGGEKKADWTPIGVAWAHQDGEGFDIVLEALPVNGRVAIRKRKRKPAQAARD